MQVTLTPVLSLLVQLDLIGSLCTICLRLYMRFIFTCAGHQLSLRSIFDWDFTHQGGEKNTTKNEVQKQYRSHSKRCIKAKCFKNLFQNLHKFNTLKHLSAIPNFCLGESNSQTRAESLTLKALSSKIVHWQTREGIEWGFKKHLVYECTRKPKAFFISCKSKLSDRINYHSSPVLTNVTHSTGLLELTLNRLYKPIPIHKIYS